MANKERFKLIPSVYAFFIKDEKILLSRRLNTGFEDGNYGLPSGHAEENESFIQATIREAFEEVGVKINPNDLDLVVTMHRWCGDHERVDFFFTVKAWNGEIKNMEQDKCDDLTWFPLTELPQNTIPYIKEAISCYLNGKIYSEFGWN